MAGIVEAGQLCAVEQIDDATTLEIGGVVLCIVSKSKYLNLIKAINGTRAQVGNNRAGVNERVGIEHVSGKCTRIDIRGGI